MDKTLVDQLSAAARNADLAEMERLIKAGADVDGLSGGHAALVMAAEAKSAAATKLLLDHGAKVDMVGPTGWTALMSAAWHNASDVATVLLENGARPLARDSQGRTPVGVATEKGHTAMVQLLKQMPDEVIYNDTVHDRVVQEVYSFRRKERFTFIRKGEAGDVEAMQRESFADIADKSSLRKAFNEHKRRGGKSTEEEVFGDALPKKALAKPSAGFAP